MYIYVSMFFVDVDICLKHIKLNKSKKVKDLYISVKY